MSAFTDFYRQSRWIKLRNHLKMERTTEEGLICEHCHEPIYSDYDTILHHKIELTPLNVNDYNIAYHPDNLMFVHMRCHNEIHKRWGGKLQDWQKKVYYVIGAPCSGKSTFVKNNLHSGDIVLDIDKLWVAMSGQEDYIKPNGLYQNVQRVYDAILDQIKHRFGNWGTAWIIEGGALLGDRMRRIEALSAEVVYIDTDETTCLERLANDPSRAAVKQQWEGYIRDYFSKFQPMVF